MAPFKGPRLTSCIASGTTEIQGHCQYAVVGVVVLGHRRQQLTQTLTVRLKKTHSFTPILDCEKSTEYDTVGDQTCMSAAGDMHGEEFDEEEEEEFLVEEEGGNEQQEVTPPPSSTSPVNVDEAIG